MRNHVSRLTLLLVLMSFRQSSQELCKQIADCDCWPEPPDKYKLYCPRETDSTFIIEVNSRESVLVNCNLKPSWADFKYQSTVSVPEEVHSFWFQKCSLPDVPLKEITRRIGVQPVKILRFESYQNLGSAMERRYLAGFPNLTWLSLNSNGLTELPEDLFDDLPELTILQLVKNNVVLPAGIFKNLSQLRRLELGQNGITHIEPFLFVNLTRLEFLGLWGNRFSSLDPRTFDGLSGLKMLNMVANNLTALPSEIFNPLGNLNNLSIDKNYFASLPGDLFSHNSNLTEIHLQSNKGNMTTLPPGLLSNLTKLNKVDLQYNWLKTLPENLLWGSSAVTNFDLRGNSLTTLPKLIFKDMVNLTLLDLSLNKLTNLPDGLFMPLKKLEKLELRNNNLTFISQEMFLGLSSLTELNLQSNGLRLIDQYGFNPLTALRIARLSYNNLTLESGNSYQINSPFQKCRELEELDLAHNSITKLFNDWCFLMPKLHKLDLRYNKISYITTDDLQFVITSDLVVNMSENQITRINLLWAEGIAKSQKFGKQRNVKIDIGGNPIICDCEITNLLKYLDGKMHPAVQEMFQIMPGNLTCASPESMVGIRISDLKYNKFRCYENQCPDKCVCSMRPYDNTVFADCSHRNLSVAPKRISVNKKFKVVLNLTGNFLKEVPFVNQSGFGDITTLLLSSNNISTVSFENIPPMLEVLELHGNNLVDVNSAFLEMMKNSTTLKNLTLHGNPWNCDCEARDFLDFVQTKVDKIPEVSRVVCAGEKDPLFKMTANKLCPIGVAKIVGASMMVALLGILMGILAALYYRYQSEIKVWLFAHQLCLWFVTEEELDKDKLYDAFISYSHKDEGFVVNELLPELEEGPRPFKLCVHYRDWVAGEWIPTQIATSVENSRRTIVVLSPNFLESVWGRMEFRAAHSQALSEGRARVIVLLLGDVGPTENLDPELKAYLSMNTYVEWGDPWFWNKLRYALPHPPQATKKAAKKIFETRQHHIRIHGEKNGLIHLPGFPVTPPPNTTPPADSLKTFIGNGNLNEEITITDVLKNEMNFGGIVPNKTSNDSNIIDNGQCTPV